MNDRLEAIEKGLRKDPYEIDPLDVVWMLSVIRNADLLIAELTSGSPRAEQEPER